VLANCQIRYKRTIAIRTIAITIACLNYLEKCLSNNYYGNIDIKINKCPKQINKNN